MAKTMGDQQAHDQLAAYFCQLAEAFGLPRSVALIYHVLYLAEGPVAVAEIISRSGLSKGSVSTGIRLLERMKFVHLVVIPTDRRSFYEPELSLSRLAAGLIEESFGPTLEKGAATLEEISALDHLSPHYRARLASLRHWNETVRGLLPALSLLD
ncbi:MAG: MarR family transcriptional regulator [Akkermansiaceae bacterium]|nr:MarR family transcriptional regulator [Akkermansiaceae bacterium]